MDSSNVKPGKLRKLGGGQKIFIFRVGGCAIMGRVNFLGGGWYLTAHYVLKHIFCMTFPWKCSLFDTLIMDKI